jgi:penicillin-binding protein 2
MPTRLALKNAAYESHLFRERALVSVAVVAVLSLAILLQLVVLQIVRHGHFSTLSQENQVKIVPIAPTRGLIFSRDGVLLAGNRQSHALEVVPERVGNLEESLTALGEIISLDTEDLTRFRGNLRKKRRFEPVVLRAQPNEHEVARFLVNKHRFPGFRINTRLSRYYPKGPLMVHVTGYVARISEEELPLIDGPNYSATTHIGKTGVEKQYENELHGQVGYQQVEVNAEGRVIRELGGSPPIPGKDIYLTIDSKLQAEALASLADRRGAIVAVDPNTGAVLSLVSNPGYDPNEFVNGIKTSAYNKLRDSIDRPLFNRALQGQYPPGSTIKPMVALAGLTEQIRTESQTVWCPGWYSLPDDGHRYRDWKKTGHGHVDVRRAIGESCDVYFYQLAKDLGIKRLHDSLTAFGMGSKTGVDIPGEASGLVPSTEWKARNRNEAWYTGETLLAGIGQGFTLATPIQLAVASATLSRKGVRIAPRVVGQIEDPMTLQAEEIPWQETETAIADHQNWESVLTAMVDVVHGPTGTARRSGAGAAYKYAGKTGTAQLFGISQEEDDYDNEKVAARLRDHALFIAFAPIDEPVIALAIIVENGGSGSGTAAPIARRLLDVYLSQYQSVAMSKTDEALH